MRNLLESIAVNSLLRSDAQRSYGDYLGVAFSLPFQVDTNTGMGILFKAYGDAMCYMAGGVEVVARTAKPENVDGSASKEERAQVTQAKDSVLGLLQDAFPNVKNVRAELERGFRFWELVSDSASVFSSSCRVAAWIVDRLMRPAKLIALAFDWTTDDARRPTPARL